MGLGFGFGLGLGLGLGLGSGSGSGLAPPPPEDDCAGEEPGLRWISPPAPPPAVGLSARAPCRAEGGRYPADDGRLRGRPKLAAA